MVVGAPAEDLALLRSLGEDLKFVFITSKAGVREAGALEVAVTPSTAPKCERCWHWRGDVGADSRHASICARCVTNLEGPGEVRRHA